MSLEYGFVTIIIVIKREIQLFKILDGRIETIETIPAKYQDLTFNKLFGYYGSKGIVLKEETFENLICLFGVKYCLYYKREEIIGNSSLPSWQDALPMQSLRHRKERMKNEQF